MRKKRQKKAGFTLVEILVVIAILSMIAVLFAPRWRKGLSQAKSGIARTKMANIDSALGRFYIDCSRFPADSEGLEVLLMRPSEIGEDKWNGPYLKRSDLLDPWEHPYIYVAEGMHNPESYDLISYGADGQEGGEGENADIYND